MREVAADPGDWVRDEAADRILVGQYLARLFEHASRRGLDLHCASRVEQGFGTANMPRIDITVGDNALALWPDDEQLAWARGSIAPAGSSVRIDTAEIDIYVDEATFSLIVALLAGEGRVIHRWPMRDVLAARQGKEGLWLPIRRPRTGLRGVLNWARRRSPETAESPTGE